MNPWHPRCSFKVKVLMGFKSCDARRSEIGDRGKEIRNREADWRKTSEISQKMEAQRLAN
jgi:hypothetical protein